MKSITKKTLNQMEIGDIFLDAISGRALAKVSIMSYHRGRLKMADDEHSYIDLVRGEISVMTSSIVYEVIGNLRVAFGSEEKSDEIGKKDNPLKPNS